MLTNRDRARPPAAGDKRSAPRARRRGIIVALGAVASVALLGMLGLSFDLGRMYVVRSELQNYTDAAAISAATKLDGSLDGLDRSFDAATGNVNRWGFGIDEVSNVEVAFPSRRPGRTKPLRPARSTIASFRCGRSKTFGCILWR